MDTLPIEILEHILSDPVLNAIDVVNFSSTCSDFRIAVNNNDVIWKQKFFQRWELPKQDTIINVGGWKEEYVFRVKLEEKTLELLSEMSPKFYKLEELSDTDLEYTNEFVNSTPNSYNYIVEFLKALNNSAVQSSMTVSYYGNKLLKYLRKNHLNKIWQGIKSLDCRLQTLEKATIFVADWFQTTEESVEETVVEHLNNAADMVKKLVKEKYKDHPLNTTPEETLLRWRNQNIPDNMFNPDECQQIIRCINNVLFVQLQYDSVSEVWMPHLSFTIDSAVFERRTTPIILAVIYESVSRRLGVKCEVIFFPAHCLLRWKEYYRKESTSYHYVDMSGSQTFLNPECCSRNTIIVSQCPIRRPSFLPCTMEKIAKKTAQDILRADRIEKGVNPVSDVSILELLLMFSPASTGLYRQLGRYYMRKKMDISGIMKKMKAIDRELLSREDLLMYQPILSKFDAYAKNWEESKSKDSERVKTRTQDIEFAVGMIGRHKIYHYTCVIYGWDPVCKASQNWIQVNGVLNLVHKDKQPFYNVLADDGMEHYVAQENLRQNHCPPVISHPEIGHYFEEYCTRYYQPNQQLREEYPEDAAVLEKLLLRRTTV